MFCKKMKCKEMKKKSDGQSVPLQADRVKVITFAQSSYSKTYKDAQIFIVVNCVSWIPHAEVTYLLSSRVTALVTPTSGN